MSRAAPTPSLGAPACGSASQGQRRSDLHDDEKAVREATAASLRELGYSVLQAGSGGAALELLEATLNVDSDADRFRHARHERRRSGAPRPDDAPGANGQPV